MITGVHSSSTSACSLVLKPPLVKPGAGYANDRSLGAPVAWRAHAMRVQFDDCTVQRQRVQFQRGQLVTLQFGDDALQYAGLGPAIEPHVDRVPVAELGWQSTPGAALCHYVEQRLQDLTLRTRRLAPRRQQQRCDLLVLSIRQSLLVTRAAPPGSPTLSDLRTTVNSP